MTKRAGKFAAVYKKTSEKFKRSDLTFDNQNHQPGWAQGEVASLPEAASKLAKGRVSTDQKVPPTEKIVDTK